MGLDIVRSMLVMLFYKKDTGYQISQSPLGVPRLNLRAGASKKIILFFYRDFIQVILVSAPKKINDGNVKSFSPRVFNFKVFGRRKPSAHGFLFQFFFENPDPFRRGKIWVNDAKNAGRHF